MSIARWRDPATGVNPFLPTRALANPAGESLGGTLRASLAIAKNSIIGPLLAALKLVLAAGIAMIFAAACAVSGIVLSPFPPVRRSSDVFWAFVGGRSVLFILGFFYIRCDQHWIKKGLREREQLKRMTSSSIGSGDIIVANHSSYIDVLYLFAMYAPTFTMICPSTNAIRPVSLMTALFRTGEYPSPFDSSISSPRLDEICDSARARLSGPVVVFPEATTTNNRGLLQWANVFGSVDASKYKIHVVGLRYLFRDFSPTYTIGGKANHMIGLAAQFANRLDVRICLYSPQNFEADGDLVDRLKDILTQTTRLKFTSFSVRDKQEFFDYWKARRDGTSGRKSRAPSATPKNTPSKVKIENKVN
ncbi:hypothetical protein HDU84_002383 [Entophlyctis sp. JEL0112]|nr:hypothetical protein HDU84_002383 [Entophlyctis sp. JEL0112]